MPSLEKSDRCKKSCCWTPQTVCARKRACACHRHPELLALETIPEATSNDEVW